MLDQALNLLKCHAPSRVPTRRPSAKPTAVPKRLHVDHMLSLCSAKHLVGLQEYSKMNARLGAMVP